MTPLAYCPDPECGAPADEVNRYTLASTSGPVVHVVTHCVRGHRYTHIDE